MAVAAFLPQVVLDFVVVGAARFDARKSSSQPNQLAHRLGTLANNRLNRIAIAKSGARAQRVLDVRFERVVHAPHARYSALRVRGVRL